MFTQIASKLLLGTLLLLNAPLYAMSDDWDLMNQAELAQAQHCAPGHAIDFTQAPRGTWTSLSQLELENKFESLAFNERANRTGIHACKYWVPRGFDGHTQPVVIVLVHGTWASRSHAYFNEEHMFYSHIQEFATKYAIRNNCPVELISLRWAGFNSSLARKDGGTVLAQVLNNYYPGIKTLTIAHSHGCNVVNYASRLLAPANRIEHIIHLAAPVRDANEEDFKPRNFDRLTHFYSTSDIVAAGGALTQWNLFTWGGSVRKFMQHPNVTNVRVQINGSDPGHGNIKAIVVYLATIDDRLNNYRFNNDLDLNVDFATAQIQLSIRHELDINNQRHLADRGFTAISNQQRADLEAQVAHELRYSQTQKALYEQTYNRPIEQKASLFRRFFSALYQETHPLI